MYICLCNALSDRDVHAAAENGAQSVSEVYKAHGCRPQCGKCVPIVRVMLETLRPNKPSVGVSLGGCHAAALAADASTV